MELDDPGEELEEEIEKPDLGEGIIAEEEEEFLESEEEEEEKDDVSVKELETLKEELSSLKTTVGSLKTDKRNLNKALHESRQKSKAVKDEPLTEDQLLQILKDADGDAQTIMNVVKYQAEQAANKSTGKAVVDADTKKKADEAQTTLDVMYPSLADDSSEMRQAVNKTKSYYGLNDHPLGDFFATGVQILDALPSLISAAEKRGKETALKGAADGKRKESIKGNLSHGKKGKKSSTAGLSESQSETATQLNLTASQLKTFKKIVGSSASVSVKE